MKEQARREAFSDAELRAAAQKVRESLLSALPPPSICQHEFSQGFCEKMEALRSREKRRQARRRALQRVAAIFLAFIVGSGIWLTVDADAREAFISWVREVYENHVVYHFTPSDARWEDSLPSYEPSWLPDGYSVVDVFEDNAHFSALYQKGDDVMSVMVLEYYLNTSDTTWYSMLTLEEGVEYTCESLTINGQSAELHLCVDGSESSDLMWMSADRRVVFILNGFLSREDMLHIAESVILVDMTK